MPSGGYTSSDISEFIWKGNVPRFGLHFQARLCHDINFRVFRVLFPTLHFCEKHFSHLNLRFRSTTVMLFLFQEM